MSDAKPALAVEPLNSRQPAGANLDIPAVDVEIQKWRVQLAKVNTKEQLAFVSQDLAAKKITILLNSKLTRLWGNTAIGLQKSRPNLTLRQDEQGNISRSTRPSSL